MFFDSKQMRLISSGLNALSTQQQVILHNLANYETPGYKAKSVVFEDVLRGVQGKHQIEARVLTDEATEMRPDGNNVDSDNESLKLYENYVQQLYLYNKVTTQIGNYRYVLKSMAK